MQEESPFIQSADNPREDSEYTRNMEEAKKRIYALQNIVNSAIEGLDEGSALFADFVELHAGFRDIEITEIQLAVINAIEVLVKNGSPNSVLWDDFQKKMNHDSLIIKYELEKEAKVQLKSYSRSDTPVSPEELLCDKLYVFWHVVQAKVKDTLQVGQVKRY